MKKFLFYFFTILRNRYVQLGMGGAFTMVSLLAGALVAQNGLLTWYFFQPQKEVAGVSVVVSPSPVPLTPIMSPIPSQTPQPLSDIPLKKIASVHISPSPIPSPTEQPSASSEPASDSGQGQSDSSSDNNSGDSGSSESTPEPSVDPTSSPSETPEPSSAPSTTPEPSSTPEPTPSDSPSSAPLVTEMVQTAIP